VSFDPILEPAENPHLTPLAPGDERIAAGPPGSPI